MKDVFDDGLEAAILHLENKARGLELSLKLGRPRRDGAARREIRTYSIAIKAIQEMKKRERVCQHNCIVGNTCLSCGVYFW